MIKKFYLLLSCSMLSTIIFAQTPKTITDIEQVWLGVLNQTRVTNKWGFWVDIHLRTREDFFNKYSQSLNRFGVTYYLTDNTKLTAGYAYVVAFPEDNRKVSIPEHRPWQQVQWHTKYGKQRMMQWFRLDERFRRKQANDSTLADGHNFNFKLRYNIFYDIPFSSKGIVPNSFSFVVNDEVHVNFGKQIIHNTFDQNRFFLGFKYQFTEHNNLQLGYMNLFQQLASGNRYRSIHAARLFYFHNLDLRKKNEG